MPTNKILVDTNILVYAWDSSDVDKHKKAVAVFENFGKQLHLSLQNLSEFTSVMMKYERDKEWIYNTVRLLQQVMPILTPSSSDVLFAIQATNRFNMHYWDAQILAVARTNGIDSIFTEYGPIGQSIEGVTYINPLI